VAISKVHLRTAAYIIRRYYSYSDASLAQASVSLSLSNDSIHLQQEKHNVI
jgi:hypothetical protein